MDPSDGRVVSNLIVQALANLPLTLYGDGSQTRSFCYVNDLIAGIIAMMESDSTFTGPVNLGNPTEFTLNELAHLIQDILGTKFSLTYQPLPPDDPRQRKPDITLAQQKLGWTPHIDLETGLRLTIDYFRRITS